MTKEQITKLKKENEQLKTEVEELAKQLEELKNKFSELNAVPSARVEDNENQTSLQFLSDEYEDFKTFRDSTVQELRRASQKLFNIEQKLSNIEIAIESMMKYSYKYNVKIIGIQQENRFETAEETVEICIKLFKALGAKVEEQDIDIAHRVKARNTKFPPPIICKFTRRIAKESVMKNRRKMDSIDLEEIELSTSGKIAIFEHLTPQAQELYHKAKDFQRENKYAFCWTKNGEVLLKQFEDSRIVKVTNPLVLLRLPKQTTQGLPSGPPVPWRNYQQQEHAGHNEEQPAFGVTTRSQVRDQES